jgi:hypothetical protein
MFGVERRVLMLRGKRRCSAMYMLAHVYGKGAFILLLMDEAVEIKNLFHEKYDGAAQLA